MGEDVWVKWLLFQFRVGSEGHVEEVVVIE